ncbi:myb/SANT-like DNA-binding domain-containing protein 3 [Colias croceus]|uniref:myb/SANT-like DNA-binding domain-containing protein 3 n=1 Tax=Colias crocea TaxID=72248 RepID=UPI001E27DAE0|nr:myb/SANT-like DNA-binding domain-containing protein 3 [Colias croceus]
MEDRKRQRCIYVTAKQKKKLIELMTKHPELISCKVTQDFNYKDSQKLWQNIANECNSIQGARKTWRQWRKTWHDLRSKTKKRQAETNGELPLTTVMLTSAEQEALGIKTGEEYQESTEFVPLTDNHDDNYHAEMSNGSISEPESIPEQKVFTQDLKKSKVKIKNGVKSSKHSNECYLNCDLLAVQEQRKIQIKEDYLNFKKDYLRQKLKLLKEQTEALKSIASELSK